MRIHILEKINAEDNLAMLFNAYTGKLSMMDIMCVPRDSMRRYNELIQSLFTDEPTEEAQQLYNYLMPRFYQLQLLSNALCELHSNVKEAEETLHQFFSEYGGDFQRYAIERRLLLIDKYGSDDETDWEPDGFDGEGQKWKVTYKDDEESLRTYTLRSELSPCFAGDESRSELIGSSSRADYHTFTEIVARATEFCPFKAIAAHTGQDIPLYRENEEGEMVEQTFGERVTNELTQDQRNQAVAQYFQLVLDACGEACTLYQTASTLDDYRALYLKLQAIKAVEVLSAA